MALVKLPKLFSFDCSIDYHLMLSEVEFRKKNPEAEANEIS